MECDASLVAGFVIVAAIAGAIVALLEGNSRSWIYPAIYLTIVAVGCGSIVIAACA